VRAGSASHSWARRRSTTLPVRPIARSSTHPGRKCRDALGLHPERLQRLAGARGSRVPAFLRRYECACLLHGKAAATARLNARQESSGVGRTRTATAPGGGPRRVIEQSCSTRVRAGTDGGDRGTVPGLDQAAPPFAHRGDRQCVTPVHDATRCGAA
jgi:hypothetical protein